MLKIHRHFQCLIFPLYETEDYEKFEHWEIYYCDCSKTELAELKLEQETKIPICDCLYESEPDETARTLTEAFKKAEAVSRKYAPLAVFGMRL